MTVEYDIIIIGSGAGGGTVASRLAPLAQAGAKIALLEAGPHYPKDYLTQRELEMVTLFRNGGAWPTKDGAVTVSMGEAMGGSTLMYTGVTFRLPDDVCQDWNVEGITPEELRPRFDKLKEEIHVIEPDEAKMMNDNNRLFKKACEKLGYSLEKIPLNIKNCEQMGFCNLGCAKGNKQGTLAVQLPEANKKGVELIPNCQVVKIGKDDTLQVVVLPTPKGTLAGPLQAGSYQLKAKAIVIAAGTAGTPSLLQRSGFQQELPALGRYVTIHPALTVNGIYPEPIRNYKGFPKIFYTTQFTHSHDYYIETAFYYPFITTKNLGLWGKDLKEVMYKYNQLMTAIILVHDDALPENRIVLNKQGEPLLDYQVTDNIINKLCHAQQQSAELFFAAGCEQVIMPSAKKTLFSKSDLKGTSLKDFISSKYSLLNKMPIASAHLQGGARMGNDTSTSVADSWGKIHGHSNLYIADGSLFPKSSHVNPYLTIMALADRVSDGLLKRFG